MQLVDAIEAERRRNFYGLSLIFIPSAAPKDLSSDRHNCAWIARSPKNRAGRCARVLNSYYEELSIDNGHCTVKKSSNLNVTKLLSLEIEEQMSSIRPTDTAALSNWSAHDEDMLYEQCFRKALDSREGALWGEGNIRLGDYLLLIDR